MFVGGGQLASTVALSPIGLSNIVNLRGLQSAISNRHF